MSWNLREFRTIQVVFPLVKFFQKIRYCDQVSVRNQIHKVENISEQMFSSDENKYIS